MSIDNTVVEILTNKLKGTVSALDIIRWIENFEVADRQTAIDIATRITVYTQSEIEEVLYSAFEELFAALPSEVECCVVPLGLFGKSGTMISYFIQKCNIVKKYGTRIHLFSKIEDVINSNVNKEKVVVIVDDFVGTGQSFISFYKNFVKPHKIQFLDIYFVCVAGMDFGLRKVKATGTKVIVSKSNIFKKAFASNSGFFGYRNGGEHKGIALKYGQKIWGNENSDVALGYNNSQSLVAFSYGTPNNSLSIIWANKNGWTPLIPRFFNDKVAKNRLLRKTILYELSILREFGSEELQMAFFSFKIRRGRHIFSSIDKLNFSLYTILKLIRSQYSIPRICQVLGILHDDYLQLVEKAISLGLLKQNGSLTEMGLKLYYEAKKCIDKRKKITKIDWDLYEVRELNYKPKTFNGKS